MKALIVFAGAIAIAGCSKSDAPRSDTANAASAAAANADPDKQAAGTSIPAGYVARTDRSNEPIVGAQYTKADDGWEVKTGPAHILYSTRDLGNGNYTATATFEQLDAPAHPEAYGIFIGGMHIDKPNIAYTYFLVRGTGEFLVKLRDGMDTRDIVPWTASPDVPKQDASGKAKYTLSASVTNDAIKFSVNGKQIASVSKAGLPTDGYVGLRINHNLHVKVSPITIKAP